MAISFDGVAQIATLSAGTTTLSVIDLYSRWVDWVLTSDNSKFLPMFTTVGGDTIDATSGTSVPTYAFLQNGWRVRPQEANHTLNVTAGILLVQGGGDPFLNTLGSFVVRINYAQPVQAITVATGGGASITAADVWAYTTRTLSLTGNADVAAAVRTNLSAELTHILLQENGLTPTQATMLTEIYALYGLDPTKPLIVTDTTRTAGVTINQNINSNTTQTTVTRV